MRAAQDELPPKSAPQTVDKSRRRPDNTEVGDASRLDFGKQDTLHPLGFALAEAVIGVCVDQAGQSSKRWVVKLTAEGDFLIVKESIVMFGGGLDGIVLWRIGLDNGLPSQWAAPGPSGHLAQQLKSPLAGAEIGQVQTAISVNHAHHGDLG